jgi:hypothetical protein
MKFLIDAQLPRRLVYRLRESGYEAIHTLDLPEGNRTQDEQIKALSLEQQLYANGISEPQLFEIKLLLANYFAEKATEAMDKISEIPALSEPDSNRFHHATTRLLELAKESSASSDEQRWNRAELYERK